jgi:hypothetical protein
VLCLLECLSYKHFHIKLLTCILYFCILFYLCRYMSYSWILYIYYALFPFDVYYIPFIILKKIATVIHCLCCLKFWVVTLFPLVLPAFLLFLYYCKNDLFLKFRFVYLSLVYEIIKTSLGMVDIGRTCLPLSWYL